MLNKMQALIKGDANLCDPCVYGGIVTLQITDIADLQGMKLTVNLCNYFKLLLVPKIYSPSANRAIKVLIQLHVLALRSFLVEMACIGLHYIQRCLCPSNVC